jgi:YVTN family beta-propeller protein
MRNVYFEKLPHVALIAALAVASVSAQAAPFAYISNITTNDVSVIDIATNTVVATVPVGGHPFQVTVAPDGASVYVPNYNDSTISVIDTSTNTVSKTLSYAVKPYGITFNKTGTLGYVVNKAANTVSVLDSNNNVTATIPVGAVPFYVGISPDNKRVYVSNHGNDGDSNGTVSVIDSNPADAAFNTVIATIPVGQYPVGLAVSPDNSKVYVPNSGIVADCACSVTSVIPVDANGTPSPTALTTGGGYKTATEVAFSPNGRCAYVTNQEDFRVSIIDVARGTQLSETGANALNVNEVNAFNVGNMPVGLDLTDDGRYLYAVNHQDGTVSVVDVVTPRVIKTITLAPGVTALGHFINKADSVFADGFGPCGP